MCGITGYWDFSRKSSGQELAAIATRMADSLFHRGPDDSGTWVDEKAGIALGHRRLSIIDLSAEGRQPMHSLSGRYVIVFNGEIYNHRDLREQIEKDRPGNAWRGHSDTEIMLAAIEAWGVERAVKNFTGMFAFALWDREKRKLFLVRDRIGEKPLYYGIMNGVLFFASELKALLRHPRFIPEIDRNALALYLRYKYIPAPWSIYKKIGKLAPGTMLTIDEGYVKDETLPEAKAYWSALHCAERGIANPFVGSEEDAADRLEVLLKDVVKNQIIADVPLGVFLSGGVDSSAIAALMQTQTTRPVKTFSIGYREEEYSEAAQARAVANHLGTDHTDLTVSPADALKVIPRLPALYDEPFSDDSQIPTFLLSQLTRRSVTVSLSGDGGDELFGGYNRHFKMAGLQRALRTVPRIVRKGVAGAIRSVQPSHWERILKPLYPLVPHKYRERAVGDRLHKLAGVLDANGSQGLYRAIVSHWTDPVTVVPGASEPKAAWPEFGDFIHQVLLQDLMTYLPDDILVKVDRAGMAVSLETRMPYLDHRIVEFAWTLPLSMKMGEGQGKRVLRKVLHRYVPEEMMNRPKMGFGVPIGEWLRGPLKDWATELLDKERIVREGYLNPEPIRQKWSEHLSGRFNWQYHLWDVLMFQEWLEGQKNQIGLR